MVSVESSATEATGKPSDELDRLKSQASAQAVDRGVPAPDLRPLSGAIDERERGSAREIGLSVGAEMLKATLDSAGLGFMLLDAQLRVRSFNARLGELMGLDSGVVFEGCDALAVIATADTLGQEGERSVEAARETWLRRFADRALSQLINRSAAGRTNKIRFSPLPEGDWIVTYEDISAQVEVEQALARQNERFDAALTNIPHGVCMFDSDIRLVLCNAEYAKLYALPLELTAAGTPLQRILEYRSATGSAPLDLVTYFDFSNEAEAIRHVRSSRVPLRDGRTVRIAHNPMNGGGYVATHEDITEAVRAEQKIRYMGTHDGLTGLPNRTQLLDRISEALALARLVEGFALHYLDLDNFKSVNDVHGHSIGDLLLEQAVERLRSRLRPIDTLARIGGDEFVVLQAKLGNPDEAAHLARRLVEAIAEPFDLEGRQAFIGVSIGVVLHPGHGTSAEELLKNADMAMYRAKSEGRNSFRFFELAMYERAQERRLLELDLRRALANDEFELYYQPQIDAQTETIVGFEALLRWRRPSRGLALPGEFIALAEEIGVIVPIGAWVIRQACREAATWPATVSVAVNLSSHQFKGLSLVQTVVSALEASGLAPGRLELEITESVLLVDKQTTIATLNLLRELGVRIAMDDFGTGYSSLSYLRSFPFDKIKIDRSFIKDFGDRNDSALIVEAVAGLGAALGMTTTAEGVETVEQFHKVRSLGCTEVQGYYFGRPCPASELAGIFARGVAAA